jgi:hypothetical protein
MNIAARKFGAVTDLYRPRDALNPLTYENRILRLHAAFTPRRGGISGTNVYGEPLWHGVFDASYTLVGDYLVQGDRTMFIASQSGLAEPLCVLTNRRITISRSLPQGLAGPNPYSGQTMGSSNTVMGNWPASVLGVSGSGKPAAGLPTDMSVAYWTVLVPHWSGVVVKVNDLLTDDLGRHAVVATSELTDMGWRLNVKQAST